MFASLRVQHDGPVAILTLARPDRLNALSAAMVGEVAAALELVEDSDARCLVVHGAGRAFCAGADLRSLATEIDLDDSRAVHDYVVSWGRNIERLHTLRVPSIAAVHGVAYGGGFSLALACDLMVATADARLNTQYINIGINPDMGSSWLLPRRINPAAARAMFLRGNEISGRRAYELGLVSELAPDDDVLATATTIAHEVAGRDPAAVTATRALLDAAANQTLATSIEREADGIARRFTTPEFQDLLAAFGARSSR